MKKMLLAVLLLSPFTFHLSPCMAQNAKMPANVTLKSLDGQSVQSSVIQNDGKPVIVSF